MITKMLTSKGKICFKYYLWTCFKHYMYLWTCFKHKFCHDITEILLKVALNTITPSNTNFDILNIYPTPFQQFMDTSNMFVEVFRVPNLYLRLTFLYNSYKIVLIRMCSHYDKTVSHSVIFILVKLEVSVKSNFYPLS